MLLVEIKDLNALVENKPFLDQPVINKQAYEKPVVTHASHTAITKYDYFSTN